MNTSVTRRGLLRGAAVVGAAGLGLRTEAPAAAAGSAGAPRFPGHQPGRIYLGMSSGAPIEEAVAHVGRPIGLHRIYSEWSGEWTLPLEVRRLREAQAAHRLPWTSFRPPGRGSRMYRSIASGRYDADLRARALVWAQVDKPFIATFHHEPDVARPHEGRPGLGTAEDYADAWVRAYDVMHDTADLSHVAFAPVLTDWLFNPRNRRADPAGFLPSPMLRRAALVGVDPYQNRRGETLAVRLPRLTDWLDRAGFPQMMVGIGETGACDDYPEIHGARWWQESWDWCAANADRVAAVSYFNSLAHNHSGNNWLLSSSPAKLAAFRASLDSPVACTLA